MGNWKRYFALKSIDQTPIFRVIDYLIPIFMIELEVYAAGVRDPDKILELEHALEVLVGLRYKIDSNHDVVYMDLDQPTVNLQELKELFHRAGLDAKFVGSVPAEMTKKAKTQKISVR